MTTAQENTTASSLGRTLIHLVDREMGALSDTELRVLLVVIRQTIGWGKERDWLARSQLVSRTGRSAHAISRAVDELVRRGLITVEDAAGGLQETPAARRAVRGALYYRPGRRLFIRPDANLRDVQCASTGDKDIYPVEGKKYPLPPILTTSLSEVPQWFLESPPLSPEARMRIEREKERIRQRLHHHTLAQP